MPIIGNPVADWVLAAFKPKPIGNEASTPIAIGTFYQDRITETCKRPALEVLTGKSVIDFGCGYGAGSIEIARLGAKRVWGIDNRVDVLMKARELARTSGVASNCEFADSLIESHVDLIVSIDAFEHFGDPAAVLNQMAGYMQAGSEAIISFGPTWYHPRGGHLFSVFPWAHLIFSEASLCKWRSTFRDDHATRFADVDGGLNQMTISRFLLLIDGSPLRIASLDCRPIRPLRWLHNGLTREMFTACVQCVLVKR